MQLCGQVIGRSGSKADGRDRLADRELHRGGEEHAASDGEQLMGADESHGNERDSGADRHEGGPVEKGFRFPRFGTPPFREYNERHTGFKGLDAARQAGNRCAWILNIDWNLSRPAKVPADKRDCPQVVPGYNAELEGQGSEEGRCIHVGEVIAGVHGCMFLRQVLDTDDEKGSARNTQRKSGPSLGNPMLAAAGRISKRSS